MICVCDIDGVLANFIQPACTIHGKRFPYDDPLNLGIYDLAKLFRISQEHFMAPLNEEFYANLPKTPHADAIINRLEAHFGFENVYFLTMPVPTPGCLEGKRLWIDRNYPEYLRRFLIGYPKHICAHRNSILFDDCEKNVYRFAEAGGRAFLVPALWNKKHAENPFAAITRFLEVL